ncbi:hypothetical protein HYR69_07715 [Candidatus Sumerlaeota bacterium]|nr:hypothetical protein [Candidatus Sumerlaeota bacterium]
MWGHFGQIRFGEILCLRLDLHRFRTLKQDKSLLGRNLRQQNARSEDRPPRRSLTLSQRPLDSDGKIADDPLLSDNRPFLAFFYGAHCCLADSLAVNSHPRAGSGGEDKFKGVARRELDRLGDLRADCCPILGDVQHGYD